ncbi:MAG TPA: mycofactocin biosynthesis peptidyl-dipeptidase MftE [Acidimicrobiales bacterium]|nr:mycofactocin biosynthesis peptidyl-dipeptidase MftE [Acidimicrobiales bacterium]
MIAGGPRSPAELGDHVWPEVGRLVGRGAWPAVPVGSTEQHGPHLPLSCDTDVAVALCRRLAAARPDVLVAPPLPYGSSGEHAAFPGTLSIGQDALESVLVELGRSATDVFPRVLFVSAHGGNAEPVDRAVGRLRADSRDARVFAPTWSGDLHAGRCETSMLLALTPARVRMGDAAPGDPRPISQIWPVLRRDGVHAVSESGVLGDPTGATREEGERLLEELHAALLAEVDGWVP